MTCTWSRIAFVVVALLQASIVHAGSSNSLIDISADGTLLATANHDNGSVSIVDLSSGKLLREIAIGKKLDTALIRNNMHEQVK